VFLLRATGWSPIISSHQKVTCAAGLRKPRSGQASLRAERDLLGQGHVQLQPLPALSAVQFRLVEQRLINGGVEVNVHWFGKLCLDVLSARTIDRERAGRHRDEGGVDLAIGH
jgi:hypothetical protein